MNLSRQNRADIMLVLVAMIWGLTFVVIKNALDDIQPFTFNAYRFLFASLFMLSLCFFKRSKFTLPLGKAGLIVGFFLFGGYTFQTVGLQYTTATNSGFITGLAVVFVPLFATIYSKKVPGLYTIMGAIIAAVGLFFLSVDSTFYYNIGDAFTFLGTLSFAVYILLLGHYSPQFDTIPLVTLQIAVVAVLSTGCSLLFEQSFVPMTGAIITALLVCAIPATCLAFIIQTWAQKFTTPTKTILIITTEPIFAAIFAFILLSETFTSRDFFGAALMIIGILLVEFKGEQKVIILPQKK